MSKLMKLLAPQLAAIELAHMIRDMEGKKMYMWFIFSSAWNSVHPGSPSPEILRQKYQALVHHYTELHRHYHNLFHIQKMLEDSEQLQITKKAKAQLQLAIFYHDYIYRPGASDNEIQSKMVFEEDCLALNLEPPTSISDMIMSTALYEKQGSVNDLGDLDLATLALPYDEYTFHGKLLFEEYGNRFLEQQMIEGRRDFLVKMLSLPKIFNNDPEKDSLACANMGRQLAELLRSK